MEITGNRINLPLSMKAIHETMQVKKYLILFITIAALLTALYFILLPMLPFGAFFLPAVRFITPIQIFFAFAMGILFSLLIVTALRSHSYGLKINKGMGATSILTSIVNVFCCTPIIPTLIGILGASSPFVFQYSPPIQHFFAVDYPIFYIISILMLTYSILKTASSLGCCNLDVVRRENVISRKQEA
ncbi:MAG TPA: hypothetical protein HA289_00695 [Ferroplasma sp.]|jgi:hypothetical protein|nr:hypothetical protein [Ferroplasma sp.]